MNEVERIHAISGDLGLREGEWIWNGSGVLALHRIDRGRAMGDGDIFCSTEQWFDLYTGKHPTKDHVHWQVFTTCGKDPRRMCDPPFLYATMYGLEVNIFHSWRQRPHERGMGDMYIPDYIAAAEEVEGLPCAPLGFIIAWKLSTGRTKDLTDVLAIRKHLNLPERLEA
jgi:hypothetical protein